MILEQVKTINRQVYKPLLLLADESEDMVQTYIDAGELYEIRMQDDIIGVALYIEEAPHVIELKNIAIRPTYRGQGIGKQVITDSFRIMKDKGYAKMIVGTANCSIDNIALYQKLGFRLYDVKRDFFKQYRKHIIEFGILAIDMWMFEKQL